MKNLSSRLTLSVAALVLASGCSEPSSPPAPTLTQQNSAGSNLLGIDLGGVVTSLTNLLVPPLTRNTPLASDVSWSFVAGPGGAVSYNSGVGLTIAVPSGALSSNVTITVTALQGSPVAYKFEPHGLLFAKNVVLTQNLRGTSAGGLLSLPVLSGAYFATDRLELNDDGLATVTETIGAVSSLLTKTVSFPIRHFSGYLVASGRAQD